MDVSGNSTHDSPINDDTVAPESTVAQDEDAGPNWFGDWDDSEDSLRRKKPLKTFPSPFDFRLREPITLVELRMNYFSGKIRSKPNWWEKVHDADIVAKWRSEIVEHDQVVVEKLWGGEERFEHAQGKKKWPRDPITTAQLDYIFDELKYAASQRDRETGIYVSRCSESYLCRKLTFPPGIRGLRSARIEVAHPYRD